MQNEKPRLRYRRTLEMTISREEFLRLLPAAVGPFDVDPVAPASDVAHASWLAHPRGTIRLVPLPPRQLGTVAVPRHRAEVALEECSAAEGDAFMDRFHRAFLRGGG